MSGPGDDPMLDDYLKRGADVSRRYREIEADAVPPELDRRVLDQARAAVSKPRSWMRWSAPIALAASTVLVVSIVIETGVDKDAVLDETALQAPEAPLPAQDAPPPPAAEAAAAAPAAESDRNDTATPSSVQSGVIEERAMYGTRRRAPVIPGEAPEPVMIVPVPQAKREAALPAPEAMAVDSSAMTVQSPAEAKVEEVVIAPSPAMRQRESSVGRASGASQSADAVTVTGRSESQSDSSSDKANEALDDRAEALPSAESWLERIRELRRDGKTDEADREWSRFREVFPDYPVAEADAARKPDSR